MKYSKEVVIDGPLVQVAELFGDMDKRNEWQPGQVGYEVQSGAKGEAGSVAKITYQMGSREMEMIETTITCNPPHLFVYHYQSGKMWNEVRLTFRKADDKTLLRVETEFRCKGLMVCLLWFFPGMFKKQTLQYMQDFKRFFETQGKG